MDWLFPVQYITGMAFAGLALLFCWLAFDVKGGKWLRVVLFLLCFGSMYAAVVTIP